MKEKKADIISVAKAARVSPSTVSRYFNHPDLVKLTTRRKIERAVRKQGYIRNRAAQTIHGIRSGTIGVVVPTLDHAIFAEVVQAFSDTVAELGFTILLASHGYDQRREYEILRKLLEHRVDGVVLTGLDHDDAVFPLVDSQDVPLVLMWNYREATSHICIGADNRLAGRMIAEHVLALGHTEIGCMFPPTDGNDRAEARRLAVMETLSDGGIKVPKGWRLETVYSVSASKRDTIELLATGPRPTAIICGNDVLATGAIYGATASGLAIPEDITIVGIGDFRGAAEIEPPLTTVHIPAREIGTEAGAALAEAITRPDVAQVSKHCAPRLVVRSSCSSPRREGSVSEAPS